MSDDEMKGFLGVDMFTLIAELGQSLYIFYKDGSFRAVSKRNFQKP